jgi:hypothetical protein
LTARALRLFAAAVSLSALAACATTRPARTFPPASADDATQALAAWASARERAATLPPSRLLYDAKMSSGATPTVPGTLAVTYDGTSVVTASLTGPFGSRVVEYRDGVLTGQDRQAFVVDPEALRAVLAGFWNGDTPSVEGFDAGQSLLSLDAAGARVLAVLDVASRSLVSMDVTGPSGHLLVDYSGTTDPWPARLTVRDEARKKSLALKLVAVEPIAGSAGSAVR